ncbi:MAG: hypothetical protein K940chlam2_00214 [Chlamydiae bacterium]|nr:hypothetical protein [Chlamydiota bacterium]
MYSICHQQIQAIFHIFFLADILGYLQEKICKILTESVDGKSKIRWQSRVKGSQADKGFFLCTFNDFRGPFYFIDAGQLFP